MQLLYEAISVGMLVVIVTHGLGYIFSLNDTLSDVYEDSLAVKLFISGFVTHLVFEYFGFNKWYCKNGFACK